MGNLGLKLSLIALLGLFLSVFGGSLEGRFASVVSDVHLLRVVEAKNGYSRIWGTFRIDRPNCNFAGLKWELTGASRKVGATVTFEGGAKERSGGLNEFGPWLVQLTPNQLQNSSLATAFHRCPYRWWETESTFYSAGG